MRCRKVPNFDLWYPLGISATLYSLLTLRLALRRVARRIRELLGLGTEELEVASDVPEQIELVYPVILQQLSKFNSRDHKTSSRTS